MRSDVFWEERLDVCVFHAAARYDVKTKQIAVDFTQTNIYGAIKSELDHLDVGVLGKIGGLARLMTPVDRLPAVREQLLCFW